MVADMLITSARQKTALDKTLAALMEARQSLESRRSPELVAVDLQAARQSLGEITGETTAEDVLERIFSTFCIGK
jgi:tRNA modification GTPase